MDVNFVLWSLREVLEQIPFDSPAEGPVDLDFSKILVPYYVKNDFRVSIQYEDQLPYEAVSAVYSPEGNKRITVPIIMRREYEESLRAWNNGNKSDLSVLKRCCLRREIYCHEACHLTAIILAFPSERTSIALNEFLEKASKKFEESFNKSRNEKIAYVSELKSGESPSNFDKYHFPYGNDNLNYFKLYQELMFPYDKMLKAAENITRNFDPTRQITFEDVARETFVPQSFFSAFPEKLIAFQGLLAEKM